LALNKPPKIDRKTLRNPDEFMKKGQAFLDVLQEQRTRFLSVAVIAVVVVIGVYAYDIWSESKAEKAWKDYVDAEKLEGDKKVEALKGVVGNFGSSRPTYLAALALADYYFEEAKKEALKGGDATKLATDSVEWYTKALDYGALNSFEKQLVHIDRGSAYEIGKKYDDAMNDFKKASELEGTAKGLALLGTARIFELKSDPGKAAETYEKISTEQANTEYARLAKNYLRRLKSPLLNENQKL